MSMLFITEKLQNQSLEDVNFPALLEKIPYQYNTRSKTRAFKQTIQDTLLQDNGGSLLQGWPYTASQQSSLFSTIFSNSSTTTIAATTATVSATSPTISSVSSSSSRSIPIVEQYNALNETISTTPPAPPKKRHCRSLSAGEVTEGRSRWKPNASKVWRPIRQCRAKVDAYQGHTPVLNRGTHNSDFQKDSAPIPSTMLNLAGDSADPMNQYSTPPESPVPRPASATSWDNTSNVPGWLEQSSFKPLSSPWLWHRLRSLEDAGNEGLSASSGSVASLTSSVDSAPEPELTSSCGLARGTHKRAMMLMPRCKSQPCVSRRKKCGKKRRREEEQRPKLDLFKMREESLECLPHASGDHSKPDSKIDQSQRHRRPACHKYQQNKKHLRSMGMTSAYPPEEFVGLTTIASSPCENNNLPPPATFQPSSAQSSQQKQTQKHKHKQAQHWSIMITPTSSPTKEMEESKEGVMSRKCDEDMNENMCSYSSDDDHHIDIHHDHEDDDDDEDSDADTMIDRSTDRFILDPCNELDLEQIEKY